MSVRELASIFFGRSRKGVIVSLRVYLDGSGKEEVDSVITVGGFVAESALAETIEEEWEVATGGKLFHLTDFGTKSCELGSGSWDATKRQAFLKRLAGIVNRPGCLIASTSIDVASYNAFLGRSPHAHVHGPAFSACAQACIRLIEILLEIENRHQQKVAYVFEKGDRQHEIHKLFSDWEKESDSVRSRLRGLGFEDKNTTLLQPADLIAGTVQRCLLLAHSAMPSLDNGLSRSPLDNFDRNYSKDGVTAAVVSGHDRQHCFVINEQLFKKLDDINTGFFSDHPGALKKRLKQAPYKVKQKKPGNR